MDHAIGGGAASAPVTIPVTISSPTPNSDGVFDATYTPTTAGAFRSRSSKFSSPKRMPGMW